MRLQLGFALLALAGQCVAYNIAPVSRRWAVQSAAAAAAAAVGVQSAGADEGPSRMGGLLEPMMDTAKGYKLYKPTGWNMFDADPGVFDVKFQDIIEKFETVQVSSSPVTTATSVEAMGEVGEVGEKIAKSRNGQLLAAKARTSAGYKVYVFDIKGEEYHELIALTINKGKLYRLSAVASNKRWPKREELYKNVVASFVPSIL